MKRSGFAVCVVIAVSTVWGTPSPNAQTKPAGGDAAAGRALALRACGGCHVVEPDQPFKPILATSPKPLDFKDIANRPNTTAASLIHYLESLPAVPGGSGMANPDLTPEELREVAAFILTLRDKPGG